MTPARLRTVALIALVVAVLGSGLLSRWERAGGIPLPVPWMTTVALVVLTGTVLIAGREVRRWMQGRRSRPLEPIVAARIAALAKAAAYAGGVLAGWYAAQVVVILPDVNGQRRERFVLGALATLGAAALALAGLVAQRWCRLPPQDRQEDDLAPPDRPVP